MAKARMYRCTQDPEDWVKVKVDGDRFTLKIKRGRGDGDSSSPWVELDNSQVDNLIEFLGDEDPDEVSWYDIDPDEV